MALEGMTRVPLRHDKLLVHGAEFIRPTLIPTLPQTAEAWEERNMDDMICGMCGEDAWLPLGFGRGKYDPKKLKRCVMLCWAGPGEPLELRVVNGEVPRGNMWIPGSLRRRLGMPGLMDCRCELWMPR